MVSKNRYGQYFTVENIADFMVSLIKNGTHSSVLEPSCGKGVFLKMLQSHGYENIKAYEIDKSLNAPFDCVEYRSFVSTPLSEHFDVVIGNPPYIRWKNLEKELKDELAESALWNKYFNSLCDYLFIFILKSIEQLNDGGELIFICPEYWMNTTHSAPLRNYMIRHGSFSDIFLFKEAPLFDGVTSSFVIFRYIKAEYDTGKILFSRYLKHGKPDTSELLSRKCFASEQIPAFRVGERWILAPESKQKLLRSFERGCTRQKDLFDSVSDLYTIGDYCDIGNGMVSGLDKAFKISDTSILNAAEKKCMINVNKAKDLQPYFSARTNHYIYIKEKLSEYEFKTNYPHYYEQLLPFKESLEQRYDYGRDIPFWEFTFPRNESLFKRKCPRIFVPCKERISVRHYFRFAYASMSYYPLQDVTGIFPKSKLKENILYLLAYLNNEQIYEWLKYNGIVKGEIVEFSEAPLASIPYRPIRWNNADEVKLHDDIVAETSNYLASKNAESVKRINQYFNTMFDGAN